MIPNSDVLNWIMSPAGDCISYVVDETANASILHRSITNIANMEPLLRIARQKFIENGIDDSGLKILQRENKALEQKAKELIDSNFHSINSHGLIGLWCALETAVEDTIVLILMNDIHAIDTIRQNGYKVKNNIILPITENDARKLYTSLEKQVRQNNPVGEGYCTLLSIFGVNISLEQKTLDTLSEINSVRNCLLHRGGIIDKKAAGDAPHLLKYVGKKININSELYLTYYDAVGAFASGLLDAAIKSGYMTIIE